MSGDKMREEFEAYIKNEWRGVRLTRNNDDSVTFAGQYQEDRVHTAWKYWQASRAALVIDLPMALDSDRGYVVDRDEVREAIEAAGVKVKP